MIKHIMAAAAAFMLAGSASANCVGTAEFQTCYDSQSGNNYSIQRFGNTTMMQGSNSRTGSRWSQDSYSFGNSTQHYGRDSNGNRWSQSCYNGICY